MRPLGKDQQKLAPLLVDFQILITPCFKPYIKPAWEILISNRIEFVEFQPEEEDRPLDLDVHLWKWLVRD